MAAKKTTTTKVISKTEKLPTTATPPAKTTADLAADYQWSIALLNSNPDLRKAFRTAVTEGWSPQRFTAELQDTKWFKKNAASWRTNEIQRLTDPATWQASRKSMRADLADTASAMGAVLSKKDLEKIADQSMAGGWTANETKDALSSYVHEIATGPLSGQYGGSSGKAFTDLQALARANGYSIPKGKADAWVGSIARGDSSVDDYGQMMRRSAAASYPAFSDELLAGSDLEDLAKPYRDRMADLLELDPDTIKLTDNTLTRAMTNRDSKGTAVPMDLGTFADTVRSDTRWQYTDNAHKSVAASVMGIGEMFGRTG